jgi:nicotinamidase-related amidase
MALRVGAALARASRYARVLVASSRDAPLGSTAGTAAATGRAALMLIDLQKDYISGGDLVAGQASPLLEEFPELPGNVERLLARARDRATSPAPLVFLAGPGPARATGDARRARARARQRGRLGVAALVGRAPPAGRRRIRLGLSPPSPASRGAGSPGRAGTQASPSPGRRSATASRSSSSTRSPPAFFFFLFFRPATRARRYDAFLSGDCSTRLRAHLAATGVRRLYVCGALTKACVMFTANSASPLPRRVFFSSPFRRSSWDAARRFTLGYEVCVVADCCADRSRAHHDAVLSVYDGYHVRVVQSGDVV